MKNDTTFVRMGSGDHLLAAKTSKKGTSLRRFNFLLIEIDRNCFRRMKEEGQIYKATDFVIFAQGLSYDLSKFSNDFISFFRL